MLGRSSGNHDWQLANASDCVWMETGLNIRAETDNWGTWFSPAANLAAKLAADERKMHENHSRLT